MITHLFVQVSKRSDSLCNFLLADPKHWGGSGNKIMYRHYATLYFVFVCDESESELGILDLIQVFVETLDKCFENVCELDLIFHPDKVFIHSFGQNLLLTQFLVLSTFLTTFSPLRKINHFSAITSWTRSAWVGWYLKQTLPKFFAQLMA
eukprot:c9197_g1_i1.p1 GENE.c9197_g1_i1~~c9197_g1_i1.p1  ORF type:complete len:150 (-),score=17.57 c9197_g1_i1:356-805(-)